MSMGESYGEFPWRLTSSRFTWRRDLMTAGTLLPGDFPIEISKDLRASNAPGIRISTLASPILIWFHIELITYSTLQEEHSNLTL